jgi:hypothetical protein
MIPDNWQGFLVLRLFSLVIESQYTDAEALYRPLVEARQREECKDTD